MSRNPFRVDCITFDLDLNFGQPSQLLILRPASVVSQVAFCHRVNRRTTTIAVQSCTFGHQPAGPTSPQSTHRARAQFVTDGRDRCQCQRDTAASWLIVEARPRAVRQASLIQLYELTHAHHRRVAQHQPTTSRSELRQPSNLLIEYSPITLATTRVQNGISLIDSKY